MFIILFSQNHWFISRYLACSNFSLRRLLTSGTGEQFVNADGFGITWYTEARSEFNPLKNEPSPGEQVVGQGGLHGLSLPFVRGPHPAMYKTIIAKP